MIKFVFHRNMFKSKPKIDIYIMTVDAETDYLNDYWTNCENATRNVSGKWLCYDLLFIPHRNFKLTLNMLYA